MNWISHFVDEIETVSKFYEEVFIEKLNKFFVL